MLQLRDRWVLVTGASSGLGREMALLLAREYGARLVLVARRREKLEAIQAELAAQGHGLCRLICADLTQADDVERVFRQGIEQPLAAVILNAGVTYYGRHSELSWEESERLLATNLTSVSRLVHLFLPHLSTAGQPAAIMLVASLGGLLPLPYQALYAATKGFLVQLGQSLAAELHDSPVSICTFAPGGIRTEMGQLSGLDALFADTPLLQSAPDCARAAVSAMVTGRVLAVPGLLNKLQLQLTRLLPRRWVLALAERTYRKGLD
jgi:short-subunit dehydrogenase